MRIIAIEKDLNSVPQENRESILREEAHAVWGLYQRSIIREIYLHRDRPQAILILECSSENEAADLLNSLPLVEKGYTTFDIIPLVPYPGFSRLFKD